MTKDPMPILIAEDNEAQRHYLSELLTDKFPEHAPVLEANDGESAVRMALESASGTLDTRHSNAEGVGCEGSQVDLERIPRGPNHFLDAVSGRDLHQRDPQDRSLDRAAADLRIHSQEQS